MTDVMSEPNAENKIEDITVEQLRTFRVGDRILGHGFMFKERVEYPITSERNLEIKLNSTEYDETLKVFAAKINSEPSVKEVFRAFLEKEGNIQAVANMYGYESKPNCITDIIETMPVAWSEVAHLKRGDRLKQLERSYSFRILTNICTRLINHNKNQITYKENLRVLQDAGSILRMNLLDENSDILFDNEQVTLIIKDLIINSEEISIRLIMDAYDYSIRVAQAVDYWRLSETYGTLQYIMCKVKTILDNLSKSDFSQEG